VAVPSPQVYVASPLGFAEATRSFSNDVLVPRLRAAGLEVLDPWAGGAAIDAALRLDDPEARVAALRRANDEVGRANAEMIERCDAVLAVLDGADVDSGTAAEVGYAAALGRPIVGWRSDFRSAGDNAGSVVNLQVQHFIERTGGRILTTLDDATAALLELVAR
jgi:nucleoside 2-deoxyribosyltransferase